MLPVIRPDDPPDSFPSVSEALTEPNGLLALGGDLSPERLMAAYRRGIFPWYSEGEPILWWSPDPRCVFLHGQMQISRRFARTLRQGKFSLTVNKAFEAVIHTCAEPTENRPETWLLPEMINAYTGLHELGCAHSIEVWHEKQLVGGLYGVKIGRVFSAESMFSRVTDASKWALHYLIMGDNPLELGIVDAQIRSPHLERLGAVQISRSRFTDLLTP